MKFGEFVKRIQGEVERLCGNGYELEIEDILKNNGVTRKGMTIRKKGETSGPIIYLDSYYERWESGELSISSVAEDIYNTFVGSQVPVDCQDALRNFDMIKDKVIYCLVSRERNEALLNDVPWVPFCDLAVVFYALLGEGREGCVSSLIHNGHVRLWGTGVEELRKLAAENTPRLRPYVIRPLWEVIKEISGIPVLDKRECDLEKDMMYVLTNKNGIHGASVVLYDNVLEEISERLGTDLVILPSSVHETMIIPYEESLRLKDLGEMVRVINQTEVQEEELLSDNVYHYSRETGMLTVAFETMAA